MKTTNNETRALRAIQIINKKNGTWEDVSNALNLSKPYCQRIVRQHYKREKNYNNLLKKARENKKAKKISKEEITLKTNSNETEVIVTETGYMLDKGIVDLSSQSLKVYVPYFCLQELEKLSNVKKEAEQLLMFYYSTRGIECINIRGKEYLNTYPTVLVKPRTIGVVALCVYLHKKGYKVRLHTKSKEIVNLAKLQNCNFNIVKY
ncbi:MAG: hypothetical protein J6O41_02450 [Clostridia bacterium]|nr:hypothetical protein [Clostridia bacterium]